MSWDERMDDFMSVLYYKNVDTPTKRIQNNMIFQNLSLLSTLVILFFLEHDDDYDEYQFTEHDDETDDIFVQIKYRMEDIVSQEIIRTEIDKQIRNFQPIKKLLLEYLIIQKNKRAIHVERLAEKCNLFFEDLLKSEKIIHLIPFTITFAVVHLTVLGESIKLDMYSRPDIGLGLKDEFAKLKEMISRYQNHFTNSFHQFFAWRMYQIKTKTSISNDLNSASLFTFQANGEVKDTINNKTVNYFAKSSNDQIFTKVFDLIKLRMFNEAKAEFMKMFLHAFSLVNFIPDYANYKISWPLSINSFWVGPYGVDTFPNGSHNLDDNSKLFYNISEDESGVITKIELRAGSVVDCIQAFYENGRNGKKIGGAGGNRHTISNLDKFSKYIIAVNLMFDHGLLSAIKFIFNDDNETEFFGNSKNRGKTRVFSILSEEDLENSENMVRIGPFGKNNEFRLSGLIGGGGKRRHVDYGEFVAHIAFRFQHVDSAQEEFLDENNLIEQLRKSTFSTEFF